MSTYERYDRALAAVYDRARAAIGAEAILSGLTAARAPLSELEVLDAGCGTGMYAALLAGRVGRVAALDLSADMLASARAKLADAENDGQVTFHAGRVEALPFPDGRFDAVLLLQVLHHLERGDDPRYGGHRRALAEARRVLRPGGVVVISACTHEQLRDGFWYYDLIPAALARSLARCAPAEVLEAMLSELGFELARRAAPLRGTMQGEAYFDPRGPLDPSFRRMDSIWALVAPDELARAEARVRALERQGALEAYVAARDAARGRLGQFTIFVAVRGSPEGRGQGGRP